jgi:anthranilate phosphoribosyltransferase
MNETLERLIRGEHLSRSESAALLEQLACGEIAPAPAGALLTALRIKGETADELAGFAQAMRSLARDPQLAAGDAPTLDIVGTGGDGSSSYNLSTGSALLAAACGIRIVKHGNRAISSTCGSADVLEALGLPLPLGPIAAAECLAKTSFTFLFAPHYHPAMAQIAPVRRALGIRTIFNMLGPLTNPARPPFGLIGAFSPEAARTIAGALSALDIRRYFVIHGAEGWDEPTPIGPFMLLDVRPGIVEEHTRNPHDLGFNRCTASDLRGGDAVHNAAAIRRALNGESGPLRDCLTLSAALALEVSSASPTFAEARSRAESAITSGAAERTLAAIAAFGATQREAAHA